MSPLPSEPLKPALHRPRKQGEEGAGAQVQGQFWTWFVPLLGLRWGLPSGWGSTVKREEHRF